MNKQQEKQARLARRHRRVRGKISGTAARPRLCVTRTATLAVYVQVIDDVAGTHHLRRSPPRPRPSQATGK
ncbi:MAG: 50S ribosomal protein L18 [Adlercreutzia equolifaciens]